MAEKSKGKDKATKRTEAERAEIRAKRARVRNTNGDRRAQRFATKAQKSHWRKFDKGALVEPPIKEFRGSIIQNQYWGVDADGKLLVCRRVPQCSADESVVQGWVDDKDHPAVSVQQVEIVYCPFSWKV